LGGVFDPSRHEFHNFTVAEVVEHMETFFAELKTVNPKAQIILTVSPVPLMATFEPRHVLQSTVYSKSVLRVACEELIKRHAHVHYFASYEIVTATCETNRYFHDDRRNVTPDAVEHVLHCFRKQFMENDGAYVAPTITTSQPKPAPVSLESVCDEEKVMAALASHAHG
jgi:hypothetical protein